jgi:hypothetical protein
MASIGLGECSDKCANPVRFTWGNDSHKTMHDYKSGYVVIALELWFLWKTLLLGAAAGALYVSGGYVGWFATRVLQTAADHTVMSIPSLAHAGESILSMFKLDWLVGDSWAGNWLLYSLLLAVANGCVPNELLLVRLWVVHPLQRETWVDPLQREAWVDPLRGEPWRCITQAAQDAAALLHFLQCGITLQSFL